jgi:hypothetical protein
VPAMFAAHVVTMNPMMMMLGPMAGHPHHFIVSSPVACSVRVIRAVPYFNMDLRVGNSRENETHGEHCYEDQFVLFHIFTSYRRAKRPCFFLCNVERRDSTALARKTTRTADSVG